MQITERVEESDKNAQTDDKVTINGYKTLPVRTHLGYLIILCKCESAKSPNRDDKAWTLENWIAEEIWKTVKGMLKSDDSSVNLAQKCIGDISLIWLVT